MDDRFPGPYDVPTPEGAEGWEELYLYSSLFQPSRREREESVFWFQDGVHWPEALTPWEATLVEFSLASLSQYNSRHLQVPPSDGIDFRILNGYVYLSPVAAPPGDVEARIRRFTDRAGFYYANWDGLYDAWMVKIRDLVNDLESLDFGPLPDVEDADAVVKSGSGVGSGWRIQHGYHRLLDLSLRLWQYHFEFLNLGYAAYLDFFGFCKRTWPSIPDLAIARMVAGVEIDLFRPDEELKRLARLAVDTGVADAFDAGDVEGTSAALAASPAGESWLESFHETADPWFNFSTGSGFYHSDPVWRERISIPFAFIRDYIDRLRRGEELARPVDAIRAERDRIVGEYASLLPNDAYREAFHARLALARVVFPYVENHNFYVEHWSHSVIWRKMRDLGRTLSDQGFWPAADDIFYLKRTEVQDALWDYYSAWATPAPAAGPGHWPQIVERRREVVARLRDWKPLPALGVPPDAVTEPFTIMLWGITSDSVAAWLGGPRVDDDCIRGFAASPGVAEGPARVIHSSAADRACPGRRDPRGAADCAELGAHLRPDRRHRDGHGGHHEPRGHRLP